MPQITFVSSDGERRTVAADIGASVMATAVGNGVPGIDAECGGACACATCHVVVEADWFDRLPEIGDGEREMLQFAVAPQPHSRLSCQITVTEAIDGLVVHTPVSQR